jgi:hypothetical protein
MNSKHIGLQLQLPNDGMYFDHDQDAVAAASADLAVIAEALADPTWQYMVSSSEKLHRRGCSSVTWPGVYTPEEIAQIGYLSLPQLLTEPDLRAWLASRRKPSACKRCNPLERRETDDDCHTTANRAVLQRHAAGEELDLDDIVVLIRANYNDVRHAEAAADIVHRFLSAKIPSLAGATLHTYAVTRTTASPPQSPGSESSPRTARLCSVITPARPSALRASSRASCRFP